MAKGRKVSTDPKPGESPFDTTKRLKENERKRLSYAKPANRTKTLTRQKIYNAKEDVKVRRRELVTTDEYREKRLAQQNSEEAKQLRRERQSTDEFKKKRNEKDREKYRTDENFRNRIKAKSYEYNRMRVENGLPLHTTKLDDNALLEWLDLHPNVGLLHAGVSFEEYVKSLTLNDLQKEFPEFVSDTFLKKKDYCVYINTFFDWEQVKGKTLGEIEKIVRAAEDDKTKKMGIYVGKYGGGQKSRPGHKYEGACFEFLEENEGSVGFTTFIINCNVGCIKTASGEKLRQLVTDSEAFASKLEAFIIEFGFSREIHPFQGMRQFLINKKREPLDEKSIKNAQRLAKQASIFDFSAKKEYRAEGDQEFLWKANAPFFFKERLLTSAQKTRDVIVIS